MNKLYLRLLPVALIVATTASGFCVSHALVLHTNEQLNLPYRHSLRAAELDLNSGNFDKSRGEFYIAMHQAEQEVSGPEDPIVTNELDTVATELAVVENYDVARSKMRPSESAAIHERRQLEMAKLCKQDAEQLVPFMRFHHADSVQMEAMELSWQEITDAVTRLENRLNGCEGQ